MIPPIAYIVMAAFLSGSWVGYETRDTIAKAEQAIVLQAERDKLIKAEQTNKILHDELITAQAETKIVYRTVVKRIPQYVTEIQKVDSECNLTNGTKRLLNSLNDVSETPSGIISTDSTPSSIRTSDLIGYTAEVMTNYNLAREQCNLLIKWQREVNSGN